MTTFTVTLKDESALIKAAQIAKLQNTSVDELIGGFLVSLTDESHSNETGVSRSRAVEELRSSFQSMSRPLGGKGYSSRDELYER
ncbi:hypothetical protein [Prosthecobacter sp.]|uniref:hypothetical protein n=1 Tax=Prosthecobacter sp. TaxID=1965333 RepID=UPI0037844A48